MVFPFDDLRKHERIDVLFSTEIIFGDKVIGCEVLNISLGGLRVRASWALPRGEEIILKIDKAGDYKAAVVWAHEGELGLEFSDDPERISDLMSIISTYGGS